MKSRLMLLLLLYSALAGPAQAGIIFGRKPAPKPEPAVLVPQLLAQARNDGDENKRAAAIIELRQFEPKDFPEMVPTLIDILLTDKKPYVRAEAAQTLGKVRPLQPQIAAALEQSLAKDSSMRVRLQARSSLIQYHWSGVHGEKKPDVVAPAPPPPRPQTNEPPLAAPESRPAPVNPPASAPTPRSQPSPAPAPMPSSPPPPSRTGSQPLPVGPMDPPASPTPEKGPDLPPP
jgi:hypothetical protein